MQQIFHAATSRGHANHGWLNSYHTFSFANYHNAGRMHFGALRVLNDDTVAPGMGFGTHPHDNMEIVSIPLSGDLEHRDSMGTVSVIHEGDIQVMSAGTGVTHSEKNKNTDKETGFLQIWIIPDKRNVEPRYDQLSLKEIALENELFQVLSPNADDQGVWIHQQAWFHIGHLKAGWKGDYNLKGKNSGVYIFVIDGELTAEDQILNQRDGLGIWDIEKIGMTVTRNAHVLLMEVPMLTF